MLYDEEVANCADCIFDSNQAHIIPGAYSTIDMSCSGMKSESEMCLAL